MTEPTLPAEQPSDVAEEATDGLEAQGGAQRAVVWHHPCGRTATTSPGVALALECEDCDLPGGWVTYSNSAGMLDTRIDEGTTIKVTWRTPRDKLGWPMATHAVGEARFTPTSALADNDHKPDGEVPEAGRAGEAQEACLYSADLDPNANKNSTDVRPQDRTEGLDAAIEAVRQRLDDLGTEGRDQEGTLDGSLWLDGLDSVAEDLVRAASPLIERAALLEVAEWLDREADWTTDDVFGYVAGKIRDRAERAVAP